jgi:hypothetical protein
VNHLEIGLGAYLIVVRYMRGYEEVFDHLINEYISERNTKKQFYTLLMEGCCDLRVFFDVYENIMERQNLDALKDEILVTSEESKKILACVISLDSIINELTLKHNFSVASH